MIDRADDHFELDISRARTAVGWEPRRSLRETMPTIVAALEADPWAWYRENELEMPRWLREVEPKPGRPGTAGLDLDRLMQIPSVAGRDPGQIRELVRGGRP